MISSIIGLPRKAKIAIIVATDFVFLALCMWAAIAVRLGAWWPPLLNEWWWLILLAPVTGVVAFMYLGTYRNVVRYLGEDFYSSALKSVSLHVAILFAILFALPVQGLPRSVPLIYWVFCIIAVIGTRLVASGLIKRFLRSNTEMINTVIFGAGHHGAELATVLQSSSVNNVVAFIDDKRAAHGSNIRNVRVYPTAELANIISKSDVQMVLLAIPDASKDRLRSVLELLDQFPVHVKTMPAMSELLSGKASVDDLREIEIEDLLGREAVAPDPELLGMCITGKSVMVTGAGGSIGSELCRQIAKQQPQTLVLVDISEFGLYQIERELLEKRQKDDSLTDIRLIPLLASIDDKRRLAEAMRLFEVDTVYHAAAYKHVPTVEANPIIAVRNNVFGSKCLAEAAAESGVEAFIMISTDKAVRPSSIMGATKNMAEQLIHLVDRQTNATRFSIVRFGNVVGSSGSVVPLFREQISKGGPVTVTDRNIERYFMTIPEAAQLVIQAGAMGSGGEQYVLDMGEPVKVYDLACRMIRLSGLHVRDGENEKGDIEIKITGLRPGEKMYEETYCTDNVIATSHPRINKELGIELNKEKLLRVMTELDRHCDEGDSKQVRNLLSLAVPGYTPFASIQDPVWEPGASQQGRKAVRGTLTDPSEA